MNLTKDDYPNVVINRILSAKSQDEVKSQIDASMRKFQEFIMESEDQSRFIETMIRCLEEFNVINHDHDAQQWSNIRTARTRFNQIRHSTQKNKFGSH